MHKDQPQTNVCGWFYIVLLRTFQRRMGCIL